MNLEVATMNNHINILVVEDDQDINRLLCEIVSQAGYQSQPAFSGTEALLYLEREDWDLILLDLMLLGKSGEQLLTEIREKYDVAIIINSEKEEQYTKVNMLRSGADDYITKPFHNEEVLARIEAQLRRYRRENNKNVLMFKDIML